MPPRKYRDNITVRRIFAVNREDIDFDNAQTITETSDTEE